MIKNQVLDLLLNGKSPSINTQYKKEVLQRYNDICLCREFGWTPNQIQDLSIDFYQDVLLFLNKESIIRSSNSKK